MRNALFLTVLVLATLSSSCSREHEPIVYEQFLAFGTLVEVTLFETDQQLAEKAIEDTRNKFNAMHEQWHAWRPSEVTAVNKKLVTGESAPISANLAALLVTAKQLSVQSSGLFDPAIGQLVRVWGFQQDEFAASAPPADSAIRAVLMKAPTMGDVQIEQDSVQSRNPSVQLDLGAIAKGYGIDQAVQHLKNLGIKNGIVNCGGDLRAFGSRGERPWNIGIRKPRGDGILASLQITDDESVFTSGDYERFFISGGDRYHHILDPRNGYPAQGVTSVTVIHKDAATADAAATALFVAGPEHWHEIAKQMNIRYVLLIDNEGTAHMNPAMKERIRFEDEPSPKIRVRSPL